VYVYVEQNLPSKLNWSEFCYYWSRSVHWTIYWRFLESHFPGKTFHRKIFPGKWLSGKRP